MASPDWSSTPGKPWATLTQGSERKIYVPGLGWQFPATINKELEKRGQRPIRDPGQPAKPGKPPAGTPPAPTPSPAPSPAPSAPTPSPAPSPAPSRPAAPAPSPAPSRPAAPAAAKPSDAQTGDKAKDMATWAKANPKLAAAAAERARVRGTAQTDNPLMKDFRSRLPKNTPSVQSPDVAKLGKGNQSLTSNPNAFKAAPPKPAAPTAPPKPAAAPEVKATNTTAATTKPTPVAPTTPRARTGFKEEYDAFDLVLEYLLSEGHADTVDEALYVMMEMDAETIGSICEAIKN